MIVRKRRPRKGAYLEKFLENMKRPLDKITNYQLELVKDKVCAAIADAVARSYEIRKSYKSAFTSDLDTLFERVDVAETVGDIKSICSQLVSKYKEVGGDLACKTLKEFLQKIEKDTLTSVKGVIYYKSEFESKRKEK